MTRDDLVRRLTHVAGELHDCPMCEPHAEAIEAAAAALAAPPAAPPHPFGCQCGCSYAAPPADLVALVREWQEAVKEEACYLCGPEPESPARVFGINERKRAAKDGILAYPLPAAPRVPDTPQGRCQHRLRKEAERCRHGFAFGATCEPCILSCAGCWDMYSSSSTYGPRPTQPPQEPPR